ncbi:glycosyl transferase [Coccomyxa subellipsoidea C-169]|uniref:GDP-Man:Man(3)GlcNAc(2)-PP-Dol alpha-1,2-mannosyltransferase n=1 Tax=Coccomyxa subellipsoidea (strain C-169) TaxID=574566 RepID=I0YS14_COCSC|nr:glycosyl transferase [Coccomyxa subellipsoidea C-169]EIE21183.1 glycosyl transferase [Coccomyxa subellipsoidea C-169]|eukprot:XP_005645727.1 glycosyl transferase [Coccomyxa subellipsoidea C-169]
MAVLSLVAPVCLIAVAIVATGPINTLCLLGALGCLSLILILAAKAWLRYKLPSPSQKSIGFFHPFADSGGGGERVLWCAVRAIQDAHPEYQILIYCQAGSTPQALCARASAAFLLDVNATFQVVPLTCCHLILPETYPRWTMLRQALGSIQLAYDGLLQAVPKVMVDTSGWAFMYPLFRLAGCRVASYTHYPTISTDMLQRVTSRQATYNNDVAVAGSPLMSLVKVVYYYIFAAAYGAVGGCTNVVMVNSSWTRGHVSRLWWTFTQPLLVYPPCNVSHLAALPLDRKLKSLFLVSLAQFRPEKDQAKQLRAFAMARQRAAAQVMHPDEDSSHAVLAARLKVVGSCRNHEDNERVAQLKGLSSELGLDACVDFCVNAPFSEVQQLLGGAVGGLHTMVDEHFGISIVEYMAAGVIPIAHNSAGPKMDIIKTDTWDRVGFLCETEEEYARAIFEVLSMDQSKRMGIAAAARRRASEFSDEHFKDGFLRALEQGLLPPNVHM